MIVPASIPSPSQGVWHVGGFPIRGYALSILAGVLVAVWIANRRWLALGGAPGEVADMSAIAVPMGIIGGRIYHVVTSPDAYFGKDGHPSDIPKIWQGGLGVWGGVLLGAIGGVWFCHRKGLDWRLMMLAAAPAIPVAQAIGRLGNWFNQELYGRATSMPWGLEIDPAHRPASSPGEATYQPTFLYELIWDLGVAGAVVWAARRWRLSGPRAMALYVLLYCIGRLWIESLRIDTAHHIFGIRLNVWTAAVGIAVSGTYLWLSRGKVLEVQSAAEPVDV